MAQGTQGSRGRFAPSPSGFMHLGNAWTALLAWLDIRSRGGAMVLRMEDLDPDRSRPEYAEHLLEDLRWLGLDWDEGPDIGGRCGPYRQSERTGLYEDAFRRLREQGLVYPCFCSRAELRTVASAPHPGETELCYSGRCAALDEAAKDRLLSLGRRPSFRLRVGAARIGFTDGLFGPQVQDLKSTCGDFVIRRADGVFAYQLAVVVDDREMGIDRIVRGADLLASTPRQIHLWRLLGGQPPSFLHVPLLVGEDGDRLSKRHGSLSIRALRSAGVRPETIVGQLAAWAGLSDRPEPASAAELIGEFEIPRLPRQPVIVPMSLRFA